MKWFKHYASLHRQPESQHVIRKLGPEWYGRYLILLELCAEQYNGEKSGCTVTLDVDYFKSTLRLVGEKWATTLRVLGDLNGFTFQVLGEFIKFEFPILAELHHKDSTSSKMRRATLGPVAGPRSRIDRDKDLEEDRDYKRAELKVVKEQAPAKKTAFFIATYCSLYKERFGHNPPIDGKEQGIAKRLSEHKSEESITAFLVAYFRMPDAMVAKAKYPLGLLETKKNEVTVFQNSNIYHTAKQAQQADETATNALLLKDIREGRL